MSGFRGRLYGMTVRGHINGMSFSSRHLACFWPGSRFGLDLGQERRTNSFSWTVDGGSLLRTFSVQRFFTSRSAPNFICGLATCNMELGTVLPSDQRVFVLKRSAALRSKHDEIMS